MKYQVVAKDIEGNTFILKEFNSLDEAWLYSSLAYITTIDVLEHTEELGNGDNNK